MRALPTQMAYATPIVRPYFLARYASLSQNGHLRAPRGNGRAARAFGDVRSDFGGRRPRLSSFGADSVHIWPENSKFWCK